MMSLWKLYQDTPVSRRDYRATGNQDGYAVQQFRAEIGLGDRWFASVRCQPLGNVHGYETAAQAMTACEQAVA